YSLATREFPLEHQASIERSSTASHQRVYLHAPLGFALSCEPDTLRLRIAEAGLLALRFHLCVLADALPVAEDDTHEWIN
ncbi:MAG: hypothetical protein DMG36_26465, partial [Acidobacteria bacterium]